MAIEPFQTAEGSEFPLVRQISIFVENRLGQLLRMTKLFEKSDVRIIALSVDSSVDCAIVRILVNDPDLADEMLRDAGFATTETEVLVVELPGANRGIMIVCSALLGGEININYTYALLPAAGRDGCIAIQVDNPQQAAAILAGRRFRVLDQSAL